MDVLRQQPVTVAARQNGLEAIARFLGSADLIQRVNIPKVAGQECGFRQAEVVRRSVAQYPSVAGEFAADRLAGPDKSGVARRQEAELGDQQDTRVQVRLAE